MSDDSKLSELERRVADLEEQLIAVKQAIAEIKDQQ